MQNVDPKILGKIKKCLALSQSDNPHEAAAAMRQARSLMAAHGVTAEHITMAEIGEARTKSRTMARDKPALWEGALASTVAAAFGCKLMLLRSMDTRPKGSPINEGDFMFVGIAAQAEIAAYTFEVLARKCKKTRSTWIAGKFEGIPKAHGGKRLATSLGDEFALGWVQQIAGLVHAFSQPHEVENAITRYVDERANQGPEGESLTRHPKTRDARLRDLARSQGIHAAQGESIHRPVNGREQLAIS